MTAVDYARHRAGFADAFFERLVNRGACIAGARVLDLGTRGKVRASAGVAAGLDDERVRTFNAELADLLRTGFPQDPLRVPHLRQSGQSIKEEGRDRSRALETR